jgi:transposase
VPLANPAALQQYTGLQYTNDHSDARWLAHVLRLGVFPAGAIDPKAERAVRDLWRQRAHWVRQHTAEVLSVPNLMARNPGARFRAKRLVDRTPADLQGRLPEAAPVLAVTRRLAVVHGLGHQSKTREKTVNPGLTPPPA